METSTPKVALRPLQEDDLELLLAWRNDQDITRFLPSHPRNIVWEQHYGWWTSRKETRYDWIIVVYGEGRPRRVGIVHYDQDTGEMGALVGEKWLWGLGIARDALALALVQLHPSLFVWAVIHPDNLGSKKAFEAVGFQLKGVGRMGQGLYVLRGTGDKA